MIIVSSLQRKKRTKRSPLKSGTAGQARRRRDEGFEVYANRKGLPYSRSKAGAVYPAAGADSTGAGKCVPFPGGNGIFVLPAVAWEGGAMSEGKIEQLYRLLERAERENDDSAAAALRCAIFILETEWKEAMG